MKFEFKPERFDDGSGSDHWFSGIYKITKYEAIPSGIYQRAKFYHAYFKLVRWKMWGNHTHREQRGKSGYRTLIEAKRACAEHAQAFSNPHELDSI